MSDKLREALTELLACHTESAGWSMSMVKDRAEFDRMLARSQDRVEAAVNAARAALAADDAARGEMPPLPEWSKMDDLGGMVPSEIRQALRSYGAACVQASRAAAPQPASAF